MKKTTDRFAFLISAYTEPESLFSLVKKLDGMLDADFIIHVDKKVNIKLFNSELKAMPNVFFVEKRIRVYWGGYSQVEMQMAMIEEMLNRKIHYTRIINLTGTDYPVVDKEILYERLRDNKVELICGFDVKRELNNGKRKMINKYAHFYLMDTYRIIRAIVKRLRLPRFAYRELQKSMYFGSEYWALTYECLTELFDDYMRNISLQKLLRFSFVPSEAWIHTVFFTSKWRDKAIKKPEECDDDLINLSPVTYFKYGDAIKILDEEDYTDIINSGRLFARKIIKGKSDGLISLLNK